MRIITVGFFLCAIVIDCNYNSHINSLDVMHPRGVKVRLAVKDIHRNLLCVSSNAKQKCISTDRQDRFFLFVYSIDTIKSYKTHLHL
jgi:hypothetical protein